MKKSLIFTCYVLFPLFSINIYANSADSITVIDLDKQIFEQVEVSKKAEFRGGTDAMFQFLDANTQYPERMDRSEFEGKVVLISFIVERDGYLSNFTYAERTDRALELAALQTILLMPSWTPAETMVNGRMQKVRSKITVPIVFL
jgi:hypothetical protein